MSKLSFALSSLVAVIPGAFMIYLLVMGFISGMPMMLMVAAGLALICGVGVVVLPVLSFIMAPKAEPAPEAEDTSTQEESVDDFADFGEEVEDDQFEEISADDEFETADGADDWDDFDDEEFKDD